MKHLSIVNEEQAVTFAGKDLKTFKSPKGGKPTMLFVTAQGSRYLISDDGMCLRDKSNHANTGGEDAGIKSWSDVVEFYDPLEKLGGSTFPMAVSKAVEKGLTIALSKANGKRALLILDASKKWKIAKISDIFKYVANTDDSLIATYSTTPKLNWNVLDYSLNANGSLKTAHAGSPVTSGVKLNYHTSESISTIKKGII